MGRKIRVDGRLYEEVRLSGRRFHRGPRKLREALDWDMFSEREKDEIRNGFLPYVMDVADITVNRDCDSAESFFESVHMKVSNWDVSFGNQTVSVEVRVDNEYYAEIDSLADIPDGKSDGLDVGEGMLRVWKKHLPKIKRAAKRYIDYAENMDDEDLAAAFRCDELQEELLDVVEDAKGVLVESVEETIGWNLWRLGTDEWFDDEISSGNSFIRDWIDNYLRDRGDSEYAGNESVRLVREAVSRGKSKKGPRKFYVGEVIDGLNGHGEGLRYEVVARTQRTVTFHVTGNDRRYNGPDGTVDDELTCKINRDRSSRDESAFVRYGEVAYA